jgi:branched-subunit amino acid aminotransferase/4-amino-4-deoxychorismate lyase
VDYVRPAPLIKHLGLAEIITLKQKAQLEGFDDVLLGKNNLVSEASTSNIFYIQAGSLLTPDPWRDACLPGITRQRVLETAQAQGLPLQASFPIPFSAMAAMDGAFLTNAAQGIRRVSRIDDITLPWPDAASAITDLLAASLA